MSYSFIQWGLPSFQHGVPLSQSEYPSYPVLFLRPMRASAWASVSPAWRSFTKVPLRPYSQSESSSYPVLFLHPMKASVFPAWSTPKPIRIPLLSSVYSFIHMRASVFPACRSFMYPSANQDPNLIQCYSVIQWGLLSFQDLHVGTLNQSSSYPVLFFQPLGFLSFTAWGSFMWVPLRQSEISFYSVSSLTPMRASDLHSIEELHTVWVPLSQ